MQALILAGQLFAGGGRIDKAGSLLPRDTELELRIRSMLGSDLPVEADLARWFPLWDLPVA